LVVWRAWDAVVNMVLLLVPVAVGAQRPGDLPQYRGVSLHWYGVGISDWGQRQQSFRDFVTYSERALGGLGMEVAYAPRAGLAIFLAGDVLGPEGSSELSLYGAVTAGVHVRRPLSRRFVPRADVAVTRVVTLATALYIGPGAELFLSRRIAANGALHFGVPLHPTGPVDKRPRRTLVGISWYLGSRPGRPAP
jgi:hypothetical protein